MTVENDAVLLTADEYRDRIREELYFLNYLGDTVGNLTHEESVELLSEELDRIT